MKKVLVLAGGCVVTGAVLAASVAHSADVPAITPAERNKIMVARFVDVRPRDVVEKIMEDDMTIVRLRKWLAGQAQAIARRRAVSKLEELKELGVVNDGTTLLDLKAALDSSGSK